ncbi:DUF362 domain-containing protein [Sporomusa sp. GT1]|uniref:DUF362 domain-containing protein n=1 Tax=Sporomusa sp. GT1 TaxID=1534747 RepID=UPI00166DEDD4|nr:DUF362 domain-containing protein [Sporomusa sp. GT1]
MIKQELHVIYGTNYRQMVKDLLAKMQLAAGLDSQMQVAIKPNLVVAREASQGATTTPAVIEGIIEYLQANGIYNISIMEGSWVGDDTKRAFRVCGYTAIAQKYGVPLYDLKDDDFQVKRVGELELKVCKKPLTADFLINVPVLKAHCQTLLTCALKNLKGCIPDSEKRRFHQMGLMKPIAYLGKALPPGITIVDAIAGDLTFEEGGNPVRMDRIIAGRDPVLLDAYAAWLLGYSPADIEYIGIAERIGAGSADLAGAQIIEHNTGHKQASRFQPGNRAKQLARHVIAKEACSACYGSLIHALQRLEDNGTLRLLRQPVCIGQGYQGQATAGLGIGQCLRQCGSYVPGCPPTAKSIVDFLEKQLR